MMIRPKMGFIVFGVHKDGLKDPLGVPFINQKIIDESKAAIEAKGVKLVENEIVVAYKQEAREALARLKHDDSVDGVILFSGTWVWASEIVAAVRDFERAGKGVIIWTVPGSQGWRLVGTLALGASFKEIGMKYRSVYGSDNDTVEKVACFSRACALRNKLNMTTIGAFGGRGMGLTCGCADPSQFMREFGVDIDSRDSMDILKAAEEVTEEEIQDVKENLIKPYFQEMPPDDGCTERSIRLYLAVKKIIEKEKFDMYVIQSFPGLAEEYAASCFTQSMMLHVLPALIILSVISAWYESFSQNVLVNAVLKGMEAGAAALIADLILDMVQVIKNEKSRLLTAMVPAAFAASFFLNLNVALILLACCCICVGEVWYTNRKGGC